VNFIGKVLNISLTQESCPFVFVCTAHEADHITVVPAAPGAEGMLYSPLRVSDDGVKIHGWADDARLIGDLKHRCTRIIRILSGDTESIPCGTLAIHGRAILRNAQENLNRLDQLSGNVPVEDDDPAPLYSATIALDEPSVIPNYVGQIVFIEIPIDYDVNHESGEYLITAQGQDSLYGVRVHGDDATLNRIPFQQDGECISIVYAIQDDDIIAEVLEKADDGSWDDDDEISSSCAVAARQLRMIQQGHKNVGSPVFAGVDAVFAEIGLGEGCEF
jgi:hypothetical protein